MLLLAILYLGLLHFRPTLTGMRWLDGTTGVALALYICSRPAINAWEWLFFSRRQLRRIASQWSGIGWLLLNLVVVLAGWLVLFVALTRLVGRTL